MRILLRNSHFRDNLIFLCVALCITAEGPALAQSDGEPEYAPVNFTQELPLTRGKLSPSSDSAVYLSSSESCKFAKNEWGWQSCPELENIVFEYTHDIDTMIVRKPNDEGHVKFDDWEDDGNQDEIDTIWDDLVLGSVEQGKRLGVELRPVRWLQYPKLDRNRNILYYSYWMHWGGDEYAIIKASKFDRKGYVTFDIIPSQPDANLIDTAGLVDVAMTGYAPDESQTYADFSAGDKVAAVGAVGVLAALVGVKYSKAAGGILVTLLLFLKKGGFLLLAPLLFLKRLFTGRGRGE
jgi:uncharacterized membrane-anchored protein